MWEESSLSEKLEQELNELLENHSKQLSGAEDIVQWILANHHNPRLACELVINRWINERNEQEEQYSQLNNEYTILEESYKGAQETISELNNNIDQLKMEKQELDSNLRTEYEKIIIPWTRSAEEIRFELEEYLNQPDLPNGDLTERLDRLNADKLALETRKKDNEEGINDCETLLELIKTDIQGMDDDTAPFIFTWPREELIRQEEELQKTYEYRLNVGKSLEKYISDKDNQIKSLESMDNLRAQCLKEVYEAVERLKSLQNDMAGHSGQKYTEFESGGHGHEIG